MTNPALVSQAAEAVLRRLPSQNGPGGYGDDFLLGWKAAIELVGQELPEALAAAQPLLQYALAPDIQALLEWRAAFDAIPVPHAPPAHKHPIDWAAAYPRMWTVLDDACEAMEMEGMHAEPSYKRLKELHRLMPDPFKVKAERATAKPVGVSLLTQSLIEAGRCLGVAQATNDPEGMAYWEAQVNRLTGQASRDLVCRPVGPGDASAPAGPSSLSDAF